jgi:glutaredoxin/glutathione-dependent peroxiredoxin
MVKAGERLPHAVFMHMTREGPRPLTTEEVCAGKRVVLFAVPGAFTPTCSRRHLPGFVEHAWEIRKKEIDTIACVAVNDAYVLDAWARTQSVGETVLMLADGNGDFTRAVGMDADFGDLGMGRLMSRLLEQLEV